MVPTSRDCSEDDITYANGVLSTGPGTWWAPDPWWTLPTVLNHEYRGRSCFQAHIPTKYNTHRHLYLERNVTKYFLLDRGTIFHEINRWFRLIIQQSQGNNPILIVQNSSQTCRAGSTSGSRSPATYFTSSLYLSLLWNIHMWWGWLYLDYFNNCVPLHHWLI